MKKINLLAVGLFLVLLQLKISDSHPLYSITWLDVFSPLIVEGAWDLFWAFGKYRNWGIKFELWFIKKNLAFNMWLALRKARREYNKAQYKK